MENNNYEIRATDSRKKYTVETGKDKLHIYRDKQQLNKIFNWVLEVLSRAYWKSNLYSIG